MAMWWDVQGRKTGTRIQNRHLQSTLHWFHLNKIKNSLPYQVYTMASIEALYIFDEHKYVSSHAIGLHAPAHLSNHDAATSF